MAITNKQIKFKFGASTKAATTDNGDIIFDATNHKIYARGNEWIGTDTHAINPFKVYAGTTEVANFTQVLDASVEFKAGSNVTLTPSGNTITIASSYVNDTVTEASKHYTPTKDANATKTVSSGSVTFASSYVITGVETDGKGHITGVTGGQLPAANNYSLPVATSTALGGIKIGYTQSEKNYPVVLDNNNKAYVNVPWSDTTYTVSNGALQFGANGGTKTSVFTANQSSNSGIDFINGGNVTIAWDGTNKKYTLGVADRYSIPTDASLNNFEKAYNWWSTTVDTSTDTDTAINKWNEIITFLKDATETDTIGGLLSAKANNSTTVTSVAWNSSNKKITETIDNTTSDVLEFAAGSNVTLTAAAGKLTIASSYTDTKNTAGSTDTSDKIFLIGATSQAANPQTYSQDTAYVGTDGCLYSGGSKVLTSHQDISGKANVTATVSTVTYDTTNKKITKTINGTPTDVVTAAKIVADGGGLTSHYETHMYTNGATAATSNVSAATTNPFIQLYDSTTAREKIQFVGSGKTTVSANGNVITISSTDADTHYTNAHIIKVGTTEVTKFTQNAEKTTTFASSEAATFGVTGTTTGTITYSGPSLNSTVAASTSTTKAFDCNVQSQSMFWTDL